VIAFPLPAAAAELPAGVQQILQQSELTPDKLVHITLQELLQTLAGWLKNAWGQPLQLARRAVLFLLLSSCVGLLADGGAWRDCVDLVAVLGFGTIALNQMTSLVQQVAQAANTSQLYVSGFVPVFAGVALLAGRVQHDVLCHGGLSGGSAAKLTAAAAANLFLLFRFCGPLGG
jgi:hypothetical protein